jgi:hypothetical protein
MTCLYETVFPIGCLWDGARSLASLLIWSMDWAYISHWPISSSTYLVLTAPYCTVWLTSIVPSMSAIQQMVLLCSFKNINTIKNIIAIKYVTWPWNLVSWIHKIQYFLYAMYEPTIQWHLQAVVAHGLRFVGFMDGFLCIYSVRSLTARWMNQTKSCARCRHEVLPHKVAWS